MKESQYHDYTVYLLVTACTVHAPRSMEEVKATRLQMAAARV